MIMNVQVLFSILVGYSCIGRTLPEELEVESSSHVSHLYLLSLVPSANSTEAGPSLVLAGQLAVDLINSRTDILPDHNLTLIHGPSGCNDLAVAEETFIRELFYTEDRPGNVVGIVGPVCSDPALNLGYLTAQPEISLLGVSVADLDQLSDRTLYENSYSVSGSSKLLVATLLKLMRLNSWNNVSVTYDASLHYYKTLFQDFNAEVRSDSSLTIIPFVLFDEFSLIQFDTNVLTRVRISYIIAKPSFVRMMLCLAINYQELTLVYPQYQTVIVTDYSDSIIASTSFIYNQTAMSCTIEQVRRAVEGAIVLRYHFQPEDANATTDTGLSHSDFVEVYGNLAQTSNITRQSIYVAAYFDAVWSLAFALNGTSLVNLSAYSYGQDANTEHIRQQLEQLNFNGISGTINFSRSTGFTDRNVDIFQVIDSRLVLLEYYDSERDQIEQYGTDSVNYIDGTFTKYSYASLPLGIFLMILTVTLVGILVCVQVLSVVYASYPSIKASSPKITHTAYLGCYIIALAIIVFIFGESFRVSNEDKCRYFHAYNCLLLVGWTFIFSTLCVRTFRIYRIFVHYLDPGRLVGDIYLIPFVIGSVLVLVPFVIGWSVAVLPTPHTVPYVENGEVVVWIQCLVSNGYNLWQLSLVFYSWNFAVAASIMAMLSIGKVNLKTFRITFVIVLCFALLLVSLLFGIVEISYALQGPRTPENIQPHIDIELFFLARCIVNIIGMCLCLGLLLIPPISPLLKEKFQKHLRPRIVNFTDGRWKTYSLKHGSKDSEQEPQADSSQVDEDTEHKFKEEADSCTDTKESVVVHVPEEVEDVK